MKLILRWSCLSANSFPTAIQSNVSARSLCVDRIARLLNRLVNIFARSQVFNRRDRRERSFWGARCGGIYQNQVDDSNDVRYQCALTRWYATKMFEYVIKIINADRLKHGVKREGFSLKCDRIDVCSVNLFNICKLI